MFKGESLSNPNKEQRKSIEHDGGVTLSAGAGSGKTFVLVEHIVFLAQKALEKQYRDDIEKAQRIKLYFSKIVLMTYTKKAAGELSVRLKKKFKQKVLECPDDNWEIALRAIDSMYVGTIHGFCYRLLSQGYFPEIGGSLEILSELENYERVERLSMTWFRLNKERMNKENAALYDLMRSSKKNLVSSIFYIFSRPELRELWRNFEFKSMSSSDIQKRMEDFDRKILQFKGLEKVIGLDLNIDEYLQGSKSTWPFYLKKYQQWRGSEQRFLDLRNFLADMKSLRAVKPRAKNISDEIKEYYTAVKQHVDFYLKWLDDLEAYVSVDSESRGWGEYIEVFSDIFSFVDRNYDISEGVSFSDLEFYLFEGLKSEEIRKNIAKSYDYFIVDEFQDTSLIQFQIIEKLINYNYKKLFCVGDVKQAIYAFRGGEVSVFEKCQELLPTPLSLVNNYRSRPEIVSFNNELFKHTFRLGIGFSADLGGGYFNVQAKDQEVPLEKKYEASNPNDGIHKIQVGLSGENNVHKPSEVMLNQLEADYLLEQIKRIINSTEEDHICVLYKNLGPSLFLVDRVITAEIPLRAQVKILQSEDPLIGIFKLCINYTILKQQEKESSLSMMRDLLSLYLKIMGASFQNSFLNSILLKFSEETKEWGVGIAFDRFLYSLDISNSQYPQNKAIIDSIVSLSHGNVEKCWEKLINIGDERYSIEFYSSKEKLRLSLMTAHASKGLQFDHVLLGGIQTNGRSIPSREDIGRQPGSFKWKKSFDQSKKYTTPEMILEREENSHKEFSEHKRLFYVACTRAVKSLNWIEFLYNEKPFSYHVNSWVNALISFQESPYCKDSAFKISSHLSEIDLQNTSYIIQKQKPPFFHRDNLGIEFKNERGGDNSQLSIICDLSVTRLATIAQCPRKFYFKNILKLEESSFAESGDHKAELEELTLDEESIYVKSSSDRGIMIHQEISDFINRNFIFPRKPKDQKSLEILEWLRQSWDSNGFLSDGVQFVSEKPIKFSLFGHMISGVPDLLIKQDHKVEIWDFKTGASNRSNQDVYWFQLFCYAYASFLEKKQIEVVKLVLSFVDERKNIVREVSSEEVESFLQGHWQNINRIELMNKKHCDMCSFGNLCHP